nr:MAG TPA: hypothetical protein [Caudoviricetes sp.]
MDRRYKFGRRVSKSALRHDGVPRCEAPPPLRMRIALNYPQSS